MSNPRADVVDITKYFSRNGKINWNAPEGRWTIYRFGFSLTGKQNHPAPPETTGLEADKLDPVAWSKYFKTYFDRYKKGEMPLFPLGMNADQKEFDDLVNLIWYSGKKNVTTGIALADVLAQNKIEKDIITYGTTEYRFLHRTLDDVQVYWINKPANNYMTAEISFRVQGLKPQIWHPDNGRKEDASYYIKDGRTLVTIPLVPDDAVFAVFATPTNETSWHKAATTEQTVPTITSPWNVKFQEKRGAPASTVFSKLQSYTESNEFSIKYFSGQADYTNRFNLKEVKGTMMLDLGSVKNIAQVYVNGTYCGTAWKEPFQVDISKAVKKGDNSLTVKVVNLWVNRLIGDEQPNCPQKITYVDVRQYKADTPLLPSGLLGPVKITTK